MILNLKQCNNIHKNRITENRKIYESEDYEARST